jgi:arylsulfatase A-like enzyme
VPPAVPTLAEAFQAAGYATVGEVANILLVPRSGFARGFDHYDARPAPPVDETTRARDIETLSTDLRPHLDEVLDRERRPPLFFYVHPFDPHAPYSRHADLEGVLPVQGAVPPGDRDEWRSTYDAQVPGEPLPEDRWREYWRQMLVGRSHYDQEVRYASEHLAELFGSLEERGVLENAVVAVAADHGEGLWDHVSQTATLQDEPPTPLELFYQEHGENLHLEAIHTPLILWGRGVPAGLRISQPVENVDLFPTLLELCNIPLQGELHGRSLVPLMRGESWEPKTHVFSHVFLHEMVRETETGWKRVRPTEMGAERGRTDALFSLADDPQERTNLATDRAEVAERLDRELDEWIARYPTVSSLGMGIDEELQGMMNDLGYAGEHTGKDSSEGDSDGGDADDEAAERRRKREAFEAAERGRGGAPPEEPR